MVSLLRCQIVDQLLVLPNLTLLVVVVFQVRRQLLFVCRPRGPRRLFLFLLLTVARGRHFHHTDHQTRMDPLAPLFQDVQFPGSMFPRQSRSLCRVTRARAGPRLSSS